MDKYVTAGGNRIIQAANEMIQRGLLHRADQ